MSVLQVDPGCTPSIKHTEASAVYKDVIFSEQNKRKKGVQNTLGHKRKGIWL
jgi:hypothetical protein